MDRREALLTVTTHRHSDAAGAAAARRPGPGPGTGTRIACWNGSRLRDDHVPERTAGASMRSRPGRRRPTARDRHEPQVLMHPRGPHRLAILRAAQGPCPARMHRARQGRPGLVTTHDRGIARSSSRVPLSRSPGQARRAFVAGRPSSRDRRGPRAAVDVASSPPRRRRRRSRTASPSSDETLRGRSPHCCGLARSMSTRHRRGRGHADPLTAFLGRLLSAGRRVCTAAS